MRCSFIHSLIAWLCLFSFGLDMAMHTLGSGICVSAGDVRFEWACEKDDRGVCLATTHAAHATGGHLRGDGVSGQDQPAPCKDLPVDADHDPAHHLLVQSRHDGQAAFTPAPVAIAVLPPPAFVTPVRLVRSGQDAIARPPDVLGRLATIVLIV